MSDQDTLDPRSRQFTCKGVTYNIKASDPYGFWTISIPKKATPRGIAGHYTSLDEAEKAIIRFSNT